MKIDGPFYADMETAAAEAARLAEAGYDGVYTLEGSRDPFFPLVLASQARPELDIATGIAVAFPRNPSHIAYQAFDLQRFSKGKFLLGIGPQIKTHIEKRFGLDFDPPAPRMREYIQAVKAFFDCWQNGTRLNFEGRFYRHTLMTPMFNPGPLEHGVPPILLGALGPKMTEVAGEVADGLIVHPFNTLPFLKERQYPAVAKGLEKSGRTREDFLMQIAAICVTGANEAEFEAAKQTVKGLLAFYGSTPAYVPPMKAVGVDDLHEELNRLSKEGRWDVMTDLIDDEFLNHFAVVGEPDTIAAQLYEKYGQDADRLSIYAPYQASPEVWPSIISELKRLSGR
ncbi:putative F420-dependent oxidoreductase [Litorivivens lipolytica]|uniref:Putative F420-dependent oxidoreductase n=1 Tax=Litorivivens lipolytica TaxID=1524264 RepID=A0A7W4W2F0_9GAMM|nr:TIGR03617 family F420-dependent LLM class oxidoreductase [Litorivivens lipolytica]MBB3046176.1 putative F420-dependent oxidoreductase [Litorivivens lipolytica]